MIDGGNNNIFFKEYNAKGRTGNVFNRMSFNNDVQNTFDNFPLTLEIIYDLVG